MSPTTLDGGESIMKKMYKLPEDEEIESKMLEGKCFF